MESYHDASNPWIPPVIRIDHPAPRDDHCAGPHLVGCRTHAGTREVASRDSGRAIGGAHRLGGCRSVSRRGKYVFRSRRHRGADGIVRFADPARCRRHWLVAAQVYRVAGGIFLVLWADGRLPWQFALPAGIGDVATGSVAVVVAALLAQNAIGARRATYAWCLFGIADLVVAVTMGAMTSPGRAHLLAFEAPNLLVASYPLVMVPTFAVPLALMLHGLVLWRLRRGAASAERLAAA